MIAGGAELICLFHDFPHRAPRTTTVLSNILHVEVDQQWFNKGRIAQLERLPDLKTVTVFGIWDFGTYGKWNGAAFKGIFDDEAPAAAVEDWMKAWLTKSSWTTQFRDLERARPDVKIQMLVNGNNARFFTWQNRTDDPYRAVGVLAMAWKNDGNRYVLRLISFHEDILV
jgi:hypothetical protein